ncbi:hypothetical protein [Myroides sp. N17-2]|uniref:hypothetical protein n=1 Tax=Myroides sp. N17-2 TaxID=2030799 RepID=UPI000EFC696C|nr:hypothetical protein [Myroides sp. N17-2]
MKITLTSIYQNTIDLISWIESLPKEVSHINLFIPIQDKHKINQTNVNGVELTLIPVDTPNLFLEFHTLYLNNKGWNVCIPMHYQITEALYAEIASIVTSAGSTTILYYKEKEKVEFLGRDIKKGGYTKEPALYLFHSDGLANNTIRFSDHQKLVAPIHISSQQPFDNFHLELDIKQQVLSYIDYTQGKKAYKIAFFTRPLSTFFYRGLIKGSFFEGKPGFILTYLYSLASFKRVLFLWMKYKKID